MGTYHELGFGRIRRRLGVIDCSLFIYVLLLVVFNAIGRPHALRGQLLEQRLSEGWVFQ